MSLQIRSQEGHARTATCHVRVRQANSTHLVTSQYNRPRRMAEFRAHRCTACNPCRSTPCRSKTATSRTAGPVTGSDDSVSIWAIIVSLTIDTGRRTTESGQTSSIPYLPVFLPRLPRPLRRNLIPAERRSDAACSAGHAQMPSDATPIPDRLTIFVPDYLMKLATE